MSKAFVSEEASSAGEIPEEPDPEGPAVITPAGHARMVSELAEKQAERAALGEALPPDAGVVQTEERERQKRLIDRRLRFLRRRLDALEVVSPDEAKRDRVYLGAWVDVEDEDGEATTYQIVGPDEADVATGQISVAAPLARALLGREAGDEVSVRRPKGKVTLTVQGVRYDPLGDASSGAKRACRPASWKRQKTANARRMATGSECDARMCTIMSTVLAKRRSSTRRSVGGSERPCTVS